MDVPYPDSKLWCTQCGVQFNHRSSLVRHIKNKCNKNQSPRRKSCSQCAANKAKCSLARPTCSRCALRNIACEYASPVMEQPEQPASPGVASASLGLDLDIVPTFQARGLSSIFDASLFEPFFDLEPWSPQLPSELVMQSQPSMEGRELLPFKDSISCVLAQAESIHQSESTSERTCVALANHSMELIFRVFRTWPQMLAEGFQLPPIFHSTHFASPAKLPKPLATCITLVKMWNGQCAGAEGIVRATIRQQLDQVVDVSDTVDEATFLANLQAVVMYLIILLSPSAPSAPSPQDFTNDEPFFRKVEIFVWRIVRDGLFLKEERAQTRPSWDEWVYVTSKRRAVLALYLLHWAYSVLHKVPGFDCRELGFMPAPAPKALWQAHTEQEWNTKYVHWLSRWSGQIYLQAEFGHIQPGAVLSPRAEKWLGEADEFGFIMVSILNATDVESPGYKKL